MKELRKEIESKILGLPEKIVSTNIGNLLVKTVGTKYVTVYNLHRQKEEKYTLKEFAFFALGKNWNVDIFEDILKEAIQDAENYFLSISETESIDR